MWYDDQVRLKADKVVMKLRDDDGRFMQSIIIPTVMYPLNGPYEVFHAGNTREATEDMYEAINSVPYKIGRCYSNTKAVVAALKAAGFNAVSYAGWLTTGNDQIPIHHCWAVVDGDIVIDLADDMKNQIAYNPDLLTMEGSDNVKKALADFVRVSRNWPNTERCYPIGRPTPWVYYVGSPCEPENAVRIWKQLMVDYPNHECVRTCGGDGMSPTQQYLHSQGLF